MIEFDLGVPLRLFTTLKAGGEAEYFTYCKTVGELAGAALFCQGGAGLPLTVLGWGSNVLPSDDGVPGVCAINATNSIEISEDGTLLVDSGASFQDVFLKAAQAGRGGLEFAVGIPGSIGGALVSNAGAYRSNVSEFLTRLEIVFEGERQWVNPSWMEFSYRDSRLRRTSGVQCAILRIEMQLPVRRQKEIYDEARNYQRQRIGKQPPPASAGSFFKNVNDHDLAQSMPELSEGMRKAGVVPAGYLIERAGLMGTRIGGAMFAHRHANFIVNVGNASAFEIRRLAMLGKKAVFERFGVELEEEVLYLGDWRRFQSVLDISA